MDVIPKFPAEVRIVLQKERKVDNFLLGNKVFYFLLKEYKETVDRRKICVVGFLSEKSELHGTGLGELDSKQNGANIPMKPFQDDGSKF